MRESIKEYPVCKTQQLTREDPGASTESLAYGSNDAGLKFVQHNAPDGSVCRGSGVVLQ
jgi:hypothetical protein